MPGGANEVGDGDAVDDAAHSLGGSGERNEDVAEDGEEPPQTTVNGSDGDGDRSNAGSAGDSSAGLPDGFSEEDLEEDIYYDDSA